MSDIAKKTLPPGLWPGSKGGNRTAGTSAPGDRDSEAAAPRSVVSPSTGFQQPPSAHDDQSETGTQSQYTHQKETPAGLQNIQEQSEQSQSQAESEGQSIRMEDNEDEEHNSTRHLKKMPPNPIPQEQQIGFHEHTNGEVPQSEETQTEGEAPQTEAPETEVPQTEQEGDDHVHEQEVEPEHEGTEVPQTQQEEVEPETEQKEEESQAEGSKKSGSLKSSLTERAKKAFDLASENQPTSEARDQFLKDAKGAPIEEEQLPEGSQKVPTDATTEKTLTQGQEEHDIPTDVQEKVQEEGQTVTGKEPTELGAPTVSGTEGQQEVPTDLLQEKAPTVSFTEQERTEKAPTVAGTEQQEEIGTQVEGEKAPTVAGTEQQEEIGTQVEGEKAPTVAGTEQQEEIGTQVEGEKAPTELGTHTQDFTEGQAPVEGSQVQEGTTVPEDAKSQMPEGTATTVPEMLDFSILKGGKVNKGGNVVDEDGKVVGRVTQGILMYLIGKKVDENGDIWSDNGKVIGKAEPISEHEQEDMMREPSPFESFPDAVVDGDGFVVSNGDKVGKVVSGDLKVLRGKHVDADGDILDKGGNVIGKAERWEPEPEAEPEPEPEVDHSILAGKRVNKAGNVVDSAGTIFGRVVEGDVKKMVGRMCDKNGHILSESGDILGKAEVVPEGEREGIKEGPFAELQGCTVAKDGTIVTPSGDVVGRLTSGDPKILFGRAVDEDGDILDRNGNVIGKAERWEPEEVEKKKNPMSGRRVNREGNVVDEDGNIIGKLTSGNLQICSGKEIDDDGDVVDSKGTVIGHCSLLEDIPQEEETPEEKEKRERAEQDRKLAIQMSVCIEQCLDKIRPICKMITEKIDQAERTPEDERDEEQLVREVRPLIEEGGRILTEAKGIIKGLDPDGRISANAKHKTAAHEATPEEYHLADVLKDLTGDVTQCIENAKRKLEDMPHAKKQLNPLWGLLNEPLFQILAAVGLLLAGVLGLVGRLLSGLGLGGLLDGLLGTLGLNRVLEGLGLGAVTESLTGGKKKKKSGGLLGGVLGG